MKNILLFISTFIVSGLLVIGTIWGLEKAGKITNMRDDNAELKTVTVEELFRLLCPDEGKEIGREEIRMKLGDRIKWDSLSLNTDVWKGKCILSTQFSEKFYEKMDSIDIDGVNSRLIKQYLVPVPMKLREKLIPCEWEVCLNGQGNLYFGFSIFSPDECYPWCCWSHSTFGYSWDKDQNKYWWYDKELVLNFCFTAWTIGGWESKDGDYTYHGEKESLIQFKGKVMTYAQWQNKKETYAEKDKYVLSCRFKSWEE